LTCVHVDLYISYHGSRASVFNDFGGATLLRGAPVNFFSNILNLERCEGVQIL